MELLYILLVLLVVTRLFGEVAVRIGQPALLGELVSGIMVGVLAQRYASVFPVLSQLPEDQVFKALTDLGAFFLMLLAGLEMKPRELASSLKGGLLVSVLGLVIPLGAGLALGWTFLPSSDYKAAQTLFLGTAMAITAVPVAAKVLMDMKQLDTPAGQTIVSAAVIDAVLSLVLLAVLTSLLATGAWPSATGLVFLLLKGVAFFAVTVAIGHYALPWIAHKIKRTRAEEFEFSALIIAALAFSVFAEWLHLHFILGAFVAGLFFTRNTPNKTTYEDVYKKTSGLTTGFLAPVFFASIGFHLHPESLTTVPVLLALVIVVAFASKIIGAGLGARLAGLPASAAVRVGIGMSARGAVELVIADAALKAGLFSRPEPTPPAVAHLFSVVVMMAIITTLLTPLFLRLTMKRT